MAFGIQWFETLAPFRLAGWVSMVSRSALTMQQTYQAEHQKVVRQRPLQTWPKFCFSLVLGAPRPHCTVQDSAVWGSPFVKMTPFACPCILILLASSSPDGSVTGLESKSVIHHQAPLE